MLTPSQDGPEISNGHRPPEQLPRIENEPPLVSIVIIFLNAEPFLAEAIESVLGQWYRHWELVLVDDGSSDASSLVARSYALRDPRIRYVDHPEHANLGMSASRNRGAAETTGPYLAFLDADDVWIPSKIFEQVEILERAEDLALVCGSLVYWHSWDPAAATPDRVVLTGGAADRVLPPPEALLACYPLGAGPGAGLDILVRRTAFVALGGFEPSFRGMYEDQAFLSKIFLHYRIYVSSRPWLLYRQHAASCCSQILDHEAFYLDHRKNFLDWLKNYIGSERLDDHRVIAAVDRAHRTLRWARAKQRLRGLARPLRQKLQRRHRPGPA